MESRSRARGAHANQQLSTASWKQLGVGGGIVAAVVLFVAWGLGGFAAARLAGRDGVRHGVWVFVVGVVLMTVVGAAITLGMLLSILAAGEPGQPVLNRSRT